MPGIQKGGFGEGPFCDAEIQRVWLVRREGRTILSP